MTDLPTGLPKGKNLPGERFVTWEDSAGEMIRVCQQIVVAPPVVLVSGDGIIPAESLPAFVEALHEALQVVAEWDKMSNRLVDGVAPWFQEQPADRKSD